MRFSIFLFAYLLVSNGPVSNWLEHSLSDDEARAFNLIVVDFLFLDFISLERRSELTPLMVVLSQSYKLL